VTARCLSTSTVFGIRMQHDGASTWKATWAFEITPERAAREGYDERLAGSFDLAPEYPGCPGCGHPSYVQCNVCKTLGCWSGVREYWGCPACGQGGVVQGRISEMSAGAD